LTARGRFSDAERQLDKLASLAPSWHRHLWVGFQSLDGNWAEAALAALQAEHEEPMDSIIDSNLVVLLAAMGLDENSLAITKSEKGTLAITQDEHRLAPFEQSGLGYALAAAGDFKRARPYMEVAWDYMDGLVNLPWFGADAVLALLASRRLAGDETGNEVLVTALQDSVHRYRQAGIVGCDITSCIDYEMAIVAWLSGDPESAAALLDRAVERGYLIRPNHAYLQFLYDNSRLTPVFERLRAHQANERRKFLAALCPNNPFAAVWQPLEGTCEKYATAD
jgi:hypothetical protein